MDDMTVWAETRDISPVISKYEKRLARRAYSRSALALVVFLLLSMVLSLLTVTVVRRIIEYFDVGIADKIFGSVYFPYVIQVLFYYIICFTVYRLMHGGIPKYSAPKSSIPPLKFLLLAIVVVGGTQLVAGISSTVDSIISIIVGSDSNLSFGTESTPPWAILLIAVVLAPIFEELMFRKFMFDRLSRFGDVMAIVFTSVTFGLFHGNLYQFIYTAVIGLVLGYTYAISRRIIYPIILHIILNLYASIPLLLGDLATGVGDVYDLGELTGAELIEEYTAILINVVYLMLNTGLIGGAVAIFVVSLVKKKVKLPRGGEIALPGSAIPRVAVLNIGCILLLIVSVYQFVVYYLPEDPIFTEAVKFIEGLIS